MNLKIYKNVLSANEEWAAKTRELLKRKNAVMWNIIGSPGSGKTALLEKIIPRLLAGRPCFVLEGDVETTRDTERLLALAIPAAQIVTHGACHVSAETVFRAVSEIDPAEGSLVFVENVGNLVCPAEFDIGESGKIAVLSVTEGEDKPLKYPLLFREAKAALLTKIDLLPHLTVDKKLYLENIRTVNKMLPVFGVSVRENAALDDLARWFAAGAMPSETSP